MLDHAKKYISHRHRYFYCFHSFFLIFQFARAKFYYPFFGISKKKAERKEKQQQKVVNSLKTHWWAVFREFCFFFLLLQFSFLFLFSNCIVWADVCWCRWFTIWCNLSYHTPLSILRYNTNDLTKIRLKKKKFQWKKNNYYLRSENFVHMKSNQMNVGRDTEWRKKRYLFCNWNRKLSFVFSFFDE